MDLTRDDTCPGAQRVGATPHWLQWPGGPPVGPGACQPVGGSSRGAMRRNPARCDGPDWPTRLPAVLKPRDPRAAGGRGRGGVLADRRPIEGGTPATATGIGRHRPGYDTRKASPRSKIMTACECECVRDKGTFRPPGALRRAQSGSSQPARGRGLSGGRAPSGGKCTAPGHNEDQVDGKPRYN